MTQINPGAETRDPVCGMTVNAKTALPAVRDGKTYYFCSNHCREKFLGVPVGGKPAKKPGS